VERTRHLVALACLSVSCLFVLVAVATGRPTAAVLVGALFVAACLVAAVVTRSGRRLGS
jgi:hypothetical protein